MREMTLIEAWDDGHETGVKDQKKADKELREAAQKFVNKIRQIEDDPRYQAVWIFSTNHGNVYSGPQYGEELMMFVQELIKQGE